MVWPRHHDEPAIYILCKVNVNGNKLLEKFEPWGTVPFSSSIDYCRTITTIFEIAVYATTRLPHRNLDGQGGVKRIGMTVGNPRKLP